jgi:hypothetical protein
MSWITFQIARLLSPEDRAVALGDLAESGVTGWRALHEIAGLVMRRQLELWKNWRPWFALIGIASTAGAVLGRLLFGFSGALGQEIQVYSHYQVFLNDATLGEVVLRLTLMLVTAFTCSWTVAFALGRVSRGALWLTGPVLYLMVLESFPAWLIYTGHLRGNHNPILMLISGALFPFNAPAIAGFLLPAIMGLRRGLRRASV